MPNRPQEEIFALFQIQEYLRKLDVVGEKISQLAAAVAVSSEREKNLTNEIAELNKTIADLDKRIESLESSALKTAGGFAVIVAIGATIGWIMSSFSGLMNFFKSFSER